MHVVKLQASQYIGGGVTCGVVRRHHIQGTFPLDCEEYAIELHYTDRENHFTVLDQHPLPRNWIYQPTPNPQTPRTPEG